MNNQEIFPNLNSTFFASSLSESSSIQKTSDPVHSIYLDYEVGKTFLKMQIEDLQNQKLLAKDLGILSFPFAGYGKILKNLSSKYILQEQQQINLIDCYQFHNFKSQKVEKQSFDIDLDKFLLWLKQFDPENNLDFDNDSNHHLKNEFIDFLKVIVDPLHESRDELKNDALNFPAITIAYRTNSEIENLNFLGLYHATSPIHIRTQQMHLYKLEQQQEIHNFDWLDITMEYKQRMLHEIYHAQFQYALYRNRLPEYLQNVVLKVPNVNEFCEGDVCKAWIDYSGWIEEMAVDTALTLTMCIEYFNNNANGLDNFRKSRLYQYFNAYAISRPLNAEARNALFVYTTPGVRKAIDAVCNYPNNQKTLFKNKNIARLNVEDIMQISLDLTQEIVYTEMNEILFGNEFQPFWEFKNNKSNFYAANKSSTFKKNFLNTFETAQTYFSSMKFINEQQKVKKYIYYLVESACFVGHLAGMIHLRDAQKAIAKVSSDRQFKQAFQIWEKTFFEAAKAWS